MANMYIVVGGAQVGVRVYSRHKSLYRAVESWARLERAANNRYGGGGMARYHVTWDDGSPLSDADNDIMFETIAEKQWP